MADNVTIPATGSGDATPVVATEQLSDNSHAQLTIINGSLTARAGITVGQKARASSFPVALATEDIAALTPPAAITGFATAANQTTELSSLASILAKLSADPSTETTLAAILAKIIAAPATSAKQDALAALIGEVQASPTANTLLDRLKSLQAALAGTLTVSGTVTANIGTAGTLATAAKQDTGNTSLSSIDGKTPALGQALAAASSPVVLTAAQITTLTPPAAITGFLTEADFDTKAGSLTETAPATDTASSGLNGRLQRVAQRLTSLIALLPTALGAGGGLKVDGSGTALPVSGTLTAVTTITNVVHVDDNAGSLTVDNGGTFAVQATLSATDEGLIGALTETAPASDTASSGLNGRLQRIAQRLTTLLAVFPTTIDTNSGSKSASTLRVVLATDQPALTTPVPTKETRSATPTQSSVSGSGTSVSLLAANSSRLGATIFNDSSALLYLKLGATASTTSFTALLGTNDYYEVPFNYTGAIDGIWSSATGAARITEIV